MYVRKHLPCSDFLHSMIKNKMLRGMNIELKYKFKHMNKERLEYFSIFTCFSPFNKTSVCGCNRSAIITINILAENLVVRCILVLPAPAHIIGNLSQSRVVIGKEKSVTTAMSSNRKTTGCGIARSFAFWPRMLTPRIHVCFI